MRRYVVVSICGLLTALALVRCGGTQSLRTIHGDARERRGGWEIGEVDTRYIGAFPSVVLDSKGRLNVTYYSIESWENKRPTGALKYAVLDGDHWVITSVDREPGVDRGRYTDAVMDSRDELSVGYWDVTSGSLRYAVRGHDGGWKVQTVEKTGPSSRGLSLELDSAGLSHLAFHSHGLLRYAIKQGSSWKFETIGTVGNVLESPALVIDPNNKDHIVFYDREHGEVKYITDASGRWEDSIIETIGEGTPAPLIGIGPGGELHVVFYDTRGKVLKHSLRSEDHWITEVITGIGDINFDPTLLDYTPLEGSPVKPSMAVDRLGHVHVSFFDGRRHALNYGILENGRWTVSEVDEGPEKDIGRYSSITVDQDSATIVYRDATANVLKYASHSIN